MYRRPRFRSALSRFASYNWWVRRSAASSYALGTWTAISLTARGDALCGMHYGRGCQGPRLVVRSVDQDLDGEAANLAASRCTLETGQEGDGRRPH